MHQPIADQHNEFCVSDLEGSQPSNCRCYQEGRVEKAFFTRVECFTVSNALEKSREIIVTVSSVLSMEVTVCQLEEHIHGRRSEQTADRIRNGLYINL